MDLGLKDRIFLVTGRCDRRKSTPDDLGYPADGSRPEGSNLPRHGLDCGHRAGDGSATGHRRSASGRERPGRRSGRGGGGRGGRGTSRLLATEGARVVVNGRDADRVERARTEVGAALGVACNLSEPGASEKLVAET